MVLTKQIYQNLFINREERGCNRMRFHRILVTVPLKYKKHQENQICKIVCFLGVSCFQAHLNRPLGLFKNFLVYAVCFAVNNVVLTRPACILLCNFARLNPMDKRYSILCTFPLSRCKNRLNPRSCFNTPNAPST